MVLIRKRLDRLYKEVVGRYNNVEETGSRSFLAHCFFSPLSTPSHMLIPRSDPTADSCSGHAPCAYDTSTPNPTDDSYLPRSGPYGYMGITIVAVLAVLFCALWLYVARQRAMQAKEQEANESEAPASKSPRRSQFCIGKRKMSPSLPLPVTSLARDTEGSMIPLSSDSQKDTSVSEKGKQPRWVSQSGVRKGLVKEVSGGMVVYTAPNKGSDPVRPKPAVPPPRRHSRRGSLNSGWQMEHLHGVRYEVSL